MLSQSCRFRVAALLPLVCILCAASADGQPIAGVTYSYDLSQADPGTGIFTTFHPNPAAQDPDNTKLTDGNLGDDTTPGGSGAVFDNETWVVVQNGGFGGAPQPKIDVVLPGSFSLASVQLSYLVEDPTFIYAPQPIPDGMGGVLFDAMTVSGAGFSEFTNDFTPVFGTGGDSGTGVIERRMATVDLGGVAASELSIDVRTPFTFIALGEILVTQVPEPGSLALLGCAAAILLAAPRRRSSASPAT